MKTIRSVIGDTWIITDKDATPKGGDRTFALNQNMQEMIDKAQQSEKWAKRLNLIGNAQLNEAKDCILVPDKNYFNFYRIISLNDPDFVPDYYSSGAQLVYPEDTRLHISESVGEPGAHYGPYYIYGRDEDGKYGVVGFSEDLCDVPAILEKLKGTKFDHLPEFSNTIGTVYDLCGGFKADTLAVCNRGMDIWTTELHTTIVNADGKIVFVGQLTPDEIITYRKSGDALNAMLGSNSEHLASYMPNENALLEKFAASPLFVPVSMHDLSVKLFGLPDNESVKLAVNSAPVELIISSEVVRIWCTPNDQKITIPESPTKDFFQGLDVEYLQLTKFRTFTILAKDLDGFAVDSSKSNSLPMDKLYDFLKERPATEAAGDVLHNHSSDPVGTDEYGYKHILRVLANFMESDPNLVEKKIPIDALIRRAKTSKNDLNECYGPGM